VTIPTSADIRAAARRIAPLVHRTPVLTSAGLDAICGFKCENFQRTSSFKIRGASNAILQLTDEQAARGVVTYSSGNHASAVACAARHRGGGQRGRGLAVHMVFGDAALSSGWV